MTVASTRLASLQHLKLLQAIRNDDKEYVNKLLENGLPDLINLTDHNTGETALHMAASFNNESMITFLLKHGACTEIADKLGRTPAMRAAEFGHVQSLQALINGNHLIDLCVKDNDGLNLLHYCLCPSTRHQHCLQLGIKYGADINNVGKDGLTLVMKFCREGLIDGLRMILQAGADADIQIKGNEESALHISCALGFTDCVKAILQRSGNPNVADAKQATPAHRAAEKGNLLILRLLSGYGADFSKSNSDGTSALHLAAAQGHVAACRFLAQRGCPALLKDKNGKTAKVLAKAFGHKDALKECRKAEKLKPGKPGTELWALKFYDWMVENEQQLRTCISEYDPEISEIKLGCIPLLDFVSILLCQGAPLEEARLHELAKLYDSKKLDLVDYELFLQGKKFVHKLYLADAGKKKRKGGSARKRGKKKGKTKIDIPICTNERIEKVLTGAPENFIEKCVQVTDPTRFDRDHPPEHPIQDDSLWYIARPETIYIHMNEAVKYSDVESIRSAFKQGYPVDQLDKFYKTPLMHACLQGNIKAVRCLVEHGANVNAIDNLKWTPLHFACHAGQLDVVQFLLEKGAHLDAQSFNGGTPIMRAIESSREAVVKLLIDAGAKIQLENKKGQTALDVARAYGDPRVLGLVQARWALLPPPPDKRKARGNKGKRKTVKKPPSSTSSVPVTSPTAVSRPSLPDNVEQKPAVLRAASTLAQGRSLGPSMAFSPKSAWMPQATTDELINERRVRRDRYGVAVDFPDYKPPFQQNIVRKMQEIEMLEIEDAT